MKFSILGDQSFETDFIWSLSVSVMITDVALRMVLIECVKILQKSDEVS